MSDEFRSITLPGGRVLAYAEYGDPGGPPLLMFHGTPGSRLDRDPLDRIGHVRLIVPERPGYGRSDPQEGRTLSGWGSDTEALADALGLERLTIMGVSGGGPHALACGARLADRIDRIGLVCGVGPLHRPEASEGMNPMNVAIFDLARSDRAQLSTLAEGMAQGITADPESFIDQFVSVLPAIDQEAAKQPEVRAMFASSFLEAVRQGVTGMVEELVMLVAPWDFDLGDVSAEVLMWQGTEDANVPPNHADLIAAELPRAKLEVVPGEGHLSLVVKHMPRMVEALLS